MKRTFCQECQRIVDREAPACPHCAARQPNGGWPDDVLIGAAVGGKYRVLRRLGQGAIGVVYLAVHVELEARRALKVLDPRLAHDERVRQRFEREARALYRLNPRHIVRLEDFGEVRPGVPYMALEYVEGDTLAELLSRGGPLPPERALRIVRQIAVALVDAAEEGVLHRDLRPGNVLLREHPTRGDEVKVLDFGIAKILGEHTLSRSGAETRRTSLLHHPQYVAPEQWTTDVPPDARTDLFSLGVLLYELVTGESPWPVNLSEPFGVLQRMRQEPARRLDAVRPDLPSGMAELVACLTAFDPEKRPASARQLVAEINRLGLLTTSVFDAIASDSPSSEPSQRDTLDAATVQTDRQQRRRRASPDANAGEPVRPTVKTATGPQRVAAARRPRGLTILAVVLAVLALGTATYTWLGDVPFGRNHGTPGRAEDAGLHDEARGGDVSEAATSDATVSAPADMVRVPGGAVSIGPSGAERDSQTERFGERAGQLDFGSERRVELAPFLINRDEVTVGAFLAWREALESGSAPCGDAGWQTLSREEPLSPVRGVSFAEAMAFCESRGRRLPTFEEWEAAARGPDRANLPWAGGFEARGAYNAGRANQPLHGLAAEVADGYLGPAPVTALGPSGWGVRGLGGNVSEWVTGPEGRLDQPPYFHRGGGYLSHPVFTQSFAYQLVADRCTSWHTVGFRCAMDE